MGPLFLHSPSRTSLLHSAKNLATRRKRGLDINVRSATCPKTRHNKIRFIICKRPLLSVRTKFLDRYVCTYVRLLARAVPFEPGFQIGSLGALNAPTIVRISNKSERPVEMRSAEMDRQKRSQDEWNDVCCATIYQAQA
jgi:hypothetical protein